MKQIYQNPDIYQIEVPLPDNPLRNLNAYVIKSQGESLIIDTGFRCQPCEEALLTGLKELGVDWDKTNLFLTHLHSDHAGLASVLMKGKKGQIFMSKEDHTHFIQYLDDAYFDIYDPIFLREGFTSAEIEYLHTKNPSSIYEAEEVFKATHIKNGDTIQVGEYAFEVVMTKGHTIGHCCLYQKEEEILFAGDHILFNITPNITYWEELNDSLGEYLNSLVAIREKSVKTIFVSHRQNEGDMYERIEEILSHHLQRLLQTFDALEEFPKSHSTKVASCLQWSMRGKGWEEFPLEQRWFAVGETIAHVEFLVYRGLLTKEFNGTQMAYSLAYDEKVCKEKLLELWKVYQIK